jgi:exo-beta-1,3-glucanase (GH17 family)
VTVVETWIAEVSTEPQIVVLVDQNDKPISTLTEGIPTKVYQIGAETLTTTPVTTPTTASPTTSSTPVAAPSSSPAPASAASVNGYGISYSPYNMDGTCKTASQVLTDFASLGEFGLARTYGTDCDTVASVYAACKATGKKLFAGIFSLSDLNDEISTLIAGVNGDWSAIYAISIGNELVNSGQASAAEVMAAVSIARGLLRAAGYGGPVVTVDTLAATIQPGNSILCDESDFCACNAHPFFDSTATAANAGEWLTTNMNILKGVLADPSQKIVITETGWPTAGSANGAAIPSPENQAAALSSIESAFSSSPSDVIFLSAFNRQWLKSDTGEFGQEYWFGILGDCPTG